MPLRDHFHPPLKHQRHWESFHARWINGIADAIDELLPEGYVTEPQVHAGASIKIDVGTFQVYNGSAKSNDRSSHPLTTGGGTAVAAPPLPYAPTLPTLSVATAFADDFEVRIFRESGGLKLVAAIELASPANKDRPESRTAFATKCASYLHNSVALVIVDVVTDRSANLHDEIVPLVTTNVVPPLGEGLLYAVAYRPIRRGESDQIDIWPHRLVVGESLPVLPLWLDAVFAVPVDLESTYASALRRARIE